MEHPSRLHDFSPLLGRVSVHQDFFWFAALLAWSLALVVWWRHPARRVAWGWLPGTALAVIAGILVQFGMFNPTFDIFIDRLVPGTVSLYKPALIDPYWLGDVLTAAAFAAMLAAWGWRVLAAGRGRNLRFLPIVVAAAATGFHAVDPVTGGDLLAGLGLLGFVALWRDTAGSRPARACLACAALLPALSTIGPVAAAMHMIQRAGPPTPMGLGAATFQALAGGLALAGLLRGLWGRFTGDSHAAFRRDTRWFGLAAGVLLVAGLFFGVQTGRDNRREIQQNRLRTAAAHALVFDPALLAPLLNPQFHVDLHGASETAPVQSAWLASGAMAGARRQLDQVLMSTPFLEVARLLVIREGWLMAVLSSDRPAGSIELIRPATPEDLARWQRKEPYVEDAPVPEIGYDYYCRAPIVAPDGRMLAWLDCLRQEYYLSIERRWRAAPFVVTALGLVLLSLVLLQRQATRQRETALRAAAVAAESSRIKTAFLANVSHELRTPLQNILGYCELLQREGPGAGARTHLESLRQQGELMARLVNDLIDLSAVEGGSFQLAPRPASPIRVVTETVESVRPRAVAKGLRLVTELGAGLPEWVLVDDARLRQVVLNLVANAVKFTDRGDVTVGLASVPCPPDRVRLTLAVRDTGPGIPPGQQGRLFVPFSRLDHTIAKEGSGLGLALAAALCRAMGGSIRVESDGRNGSCFIAMLEVSPSTAPVAVPAATPVPAGAAPRVLVVDDNRLVRELFVSFLAAQGARCRSAATGAEALVSVQGEPPDAIVLDLALPDGDGTELVPRLRAAAPSVRIVGASAHAGAGDRRRALAAGMNAFLVKPVRLPDLWAAVAGPVAAAPLQLPAAVRAQLEQDFAEELPARRTALEAALAEGNWTRVRATAHYLRNSALVVGATELLAVCTQLESLATAPVADSARLREAGEHFAAACTALQAERGAAPAGISADPGFPGRDL
ncbi:MAG TPA: ATP-binding protein [Lacunisphaera sp.]|nr:ATP-binding protein [Lacunisphaera sp.]